MSRTKEEVLNELDALELERREFMEEVRNGEGTFDKEAANAKLDNFKERKAKLEQEFAEFNRPVENESTALKLTNRDFIDAFKEHRSIVIGGTGKINQVTNLFEGIGEKDDILNKVTFEFSDNASTIIPILEPALADPQDLAEGGSITPDSTAAIKNSEIRVKSMALLLPVTAEALELGVVDIQSKLPELFKKAFRKVLHKKLFVGTFTETDKGVQGIWTDAALNKGGITELKGEKVTVTDVAKLALKCRGLDEDFKLLMNPSVYTDILSDPSTSEDIKIYKEGLIRDKMIEGVPVILDPQAPAQASAGAIQVVAAPLPRYHIGVVGKIEIKAIDKAEDTNTYYQAHVFVGGRQVTNKDFFALAKQGA